MSHLILKAGLVAGYATLEGVEGVEDGLAGDLVGSAPLASRWPGGAFLRIPQSQEKDAKLGDMISAYGNPVVSQRFRDALELLIEKSRVEFLPVGVRDRKGAPVSGAFYIMRALDVEDVIDVAASAGELNENDNENLIVWEELVVKPGVGAIFRPRRLVGGVAMVREDVAARLRAITPKLVGLSLLAPGDYSGN